MRLTLTSNSPPLPWRFLNSLLATSTLNQLRLRPPSQSLQSTTARRR